MMHGVRRDIALFPLGLLVNSVPLFHLHTLPVYSVLQRISICYFLISLLYLISSSWKNKAVVAFAALVGYWAVMRFVLVPGYGVPTHEVPLLDRDGNLVAWLGRQLCPASHLSEQTRDPEDILTQ